MLLAPRYPRGLGYVERGAKTRFFAKSGFIKALWVLLLSVLAKKSVGSDPPRPRPCQAARPLMSCKLLAL